MAFVKTRVQVLENAETICGCVLKATITPKPVGFRGNKDKPPRVSLVGVEVSQSKVSTKCQHCKGNHVIEKCLKFKQLTVKDQCDVIHKLCLCFICFSDKHLVQQCTSSKSCSKRNSKHHVLLHFGSASTDSAEDSNPAQEPINSIASLNSVVTLHDVM